MVSHIAATFLTGYIIYAAVPGSSLFSWHPTLMILAMVLLMFEAIMLFSKQSSLIILYSHATKANIHGYMMAAAASCATGGFVTIYYNKELDNKNHFTSWHGFLGIITLSFITLQVIGGLCLKYNSILRKFAIRLIDMKLYHATAGLVVFTMVSGTIYLSFFTNWFVQVSGDITWYVCLACLSCMALMVMQQITEAYMPLARGQQTQITDSGEKKKNSKKKGRKEN